MYGVTPTFKLHPTNPRFLPHLPQKTLLRLLSSLPSSRRHKGLNYNT
jgi:hypothetical protein